ncbi:MAG: CDP-diacylglycerol--serine O-phosphatidyltransferase [Nitrospirota bacterium]|nr:CDP-diacylglycerol--serine O-phosphatidyltransferase [Nitrospirota bacterium]
MRQRRALRMQELRRKGIYIIPNLFTTGNLFCGVFAIMSVFHTQYLTAATAILVGSIFDVLDGKLARLTNTTSRFGVEYDSLSDLVSFGIAPGLLAYAWALQPYGRLGWMGLFLYIVCGALRLARFNVQVSSVESTDFIGLPTPAAAILVATMVMFDGNVFALGDAVRPALTLALIYLLAFLMVSNIRYRSFKGLDLRDRKPFNVLVGFILAFMVLVTIPWIMLFTLSALYVFLGILEKPFVALYRKLDEQPGGRAGEASEDDLEDIEDKNILEKN